MRFHPRLLKERKKRPTRTSTIERCPFKKSSDFYYCLTERREGGKAATHLTYANIQQQFINHVK